MFQIKHRWSRHTQRPQSERGTLSDHQKAENNKSPGLDCIPIEIFKTDGRRMHRPSHGHLERLLNQGNHAERDGPNPTSRVIQKRNVEDPTNYRPIALLDTLYSIYASLIEKRLASGRDAVLWEMQYGFRKNRNTSPPLFITRRLQGQAESTNEKLFLVFVYLEKKIR